MGQSSPVPSSLRKRWFTIAFITSFVFFAEFPLFRITTPTRVMRDSMTDHSSHWGSAILLVVSGFDVYRLKAQNLCNPPEQIDAIPATCAPVDAPHVRPFLVNWLKYPRVYPPGAMLLGALPAALFAFTSIGFSQTNLVMILEILLGAHLASLAIFFCLRSLLDSGVQATDDTEAAKTFFLFLVFPFIHLELVSAALKGIYDPIAVAAVAFGILMLRRDRPLAALLGLSLGVFCHFRALWYLPLLLLAIMRVYDTRAMWWRSKRGWGVLALSAAMLLIAFYCFVAILPALYTFPITNPIHLKTFQRNPAELVTFGIPLAMVLAVLIRQRHWLTLTVALWQLVMLVQTREVQNWHVLFVLPLLALAATERKAPWTAVASMLVLYLWQSNEVFSSWPLTGGMLAELMRT